MKFLQQRVQLRECLTKPGFNDCRRVRFEVLWHGVWRLASCVAEPGRERPSGAFLHLDPHSGRTPV
jgi:hypothetical protein